MSAARNTTGKPRATAVIETTVTFLVSGLVAVIVAGSFYAWL